MDAKTHDLIAELRRTGLELQAELEKDEPDEEQQAEFEARERRAGFAVIHGGL
jgi:hypothetical protein